jgi:hypothetical protein
VTSRGQIVLIYLSIIGAVAWGLACVVIMQIWPPPSPALGDMGVADFYRAHSDRVRVGGAILIATAGWNVPLAAVITHHMLRLGPKVRPWALIHAMGGALMTIWLAIPAMFWSVTAFTPERDAGITRLLHELSWLCFATSIQFFVLQGVALVYVCLSQHVTSPYFPRWLGFLLVWCLGLTEVGVLAMLVKTGPFAWNGLYSFYVPVSGFFLWLGGIGYVFIRNLRGEQKREDKSEAEVQTVVSSH